MATSNTSRKAGGAGPHAKYWLRLRDLDTDTMLDLALLSGARRAGLDLDLGGAVHESHVYEAFLVTDAELEPGEALWCLNDEEPVALSLSRVQAPESGDGEGRALWRLTPPDEGVARRWGAGWTPFAQLFGFARVALELGGGRAGGTDGGLALSTRDVACICDRSDQEVPVGDMLAALMDAPDAAAMSWMLAAGRDEQDGSGVEGLLAATDAPDSSESLAGYLALCERVVRGFERNLAFFCRHAHSRTVKAEAVVAPSRARHAGRREVLWLSKNPDALCKTADGGIVAGGQRYAVTRVRTERPQVSFDTRENRALLAFAEALAASLNDIAAQAQAQVEELCAMRDQLSCLLEGEGLIPSLAVVQACLMREEPLVGRAHELRRRVRRVCAALERALPGVERVRYRLPKRTKPFQEIPAYVELHGLMRAWEDFGSFSLMREGLALRTWRMDKLYEYYLLYLLLSSLHDLGFELDESAGPAVLMGRYSLRARCYANETQVAGVYRLARGELAATLYYQPVFYADEREELGVDLHRTTRCDAFANPYWTPDYLLVLSRPDGTRTRVVFDAKFRRLKDVCGSSAGWADGGRADALLDCRRKYRLETAGPAGEQVDAVWLLCGRAETSASWQARLSGWARARGLLPDGAATAVPRANALPEVLAALGLGEAGEGGARPGV